MTVIVINGGVGRESESVTKDNYDVLDVNQFDIPKNRLENFSSGLIRGNQNKLFFQVIPRNEVIKTTKPCHHANIYIVLTLILDESIPTQRGVEKPIFHVRLSTNIRYACIGNQVCSRRKALEYRLNNTHGLSLTQQIVANEHTHATQFRLHPWLLFVKNVAVRFHFLLLMPLLKLVIIPVSKFKMHHS
jgi:hypothetical protein